MRLEFTVHGCPIPKARARVGRGHAFTPKTTADYERKVKLAALAHRNGGPPTKEPVSVVLAFYLPDRRRRDCDNLAKAVTDALNGIAYADDSQISELCISKHLDPKSPRAVVLVVEDGR